MRSPGRSRETKNPKYGRKAPARASVSETDKKFNLIKTITTMKYLIRSVKYFIALCVLYLIIMALMLLTNTSVLTPSETFSALVRSTRGQVLIVAVVLLSALYPKFGFIRRQEIGSLRKNREQILNAFVSEGFKPVRESEHEWCSGQTPSSSGSRSFSKMKSESPKPGSGSRSKVFAGV